MVDGHRLRQNHVVLLRQRQRLLQFRTIQSDRLFTEDVLSGTERLPEKADVGVVRGGDVDDVHVRVGKNVLWPVVDLGNAVLCGECHRLFVGAVCHSVEGLSTLCHCLRQFMSDDTAA